jgi:hypothetical protein
MSIKFFESIEEYEKCAFLKKFIKFFKDNLEARISIHYIPWITGLEKKIRDRKKTRINEKCDRLI